MLHEIGQLHTLTVQFHSYEIPRVVKFTDTENRMVGYQCLGWMEWGTVV